MKPTKTQTPCAACGAPPRKWTDTENIPAGSYYPGDKQVIRRQRWERGTAGAWIELTLWDGKTYVAHKYGDGLFCRLRCAETFATRAHAAGYRMKR